MTLLFIGIVPLAFLLAFVLLVRDIFRAPTLARRRRAGAVLATGLLGIGTCAHQVKRELDWSPDLDAPAHSYHPDEAEQLLQQDDPGFLWGPGFERTVYGSPNSAQATAAALFERIAPFGYAREPPTQGPSTTEQGLAPVEQLAFQQWRWRFYELPMPMQLDGVDYDRHKFAHLVAIVLSDDGRRSPSPASRAVFDH